MIAIVFETHSISVDNERGVASGWLPGTLSTSGRALANALGERRRDDGVSAVFTSDLRRAVETAEIAFAETGTPIYHDWRLRECNYGAWNGIARERLDGCRPQYIDRPFPGGESWREAVERVRDSLRDIHSMYESDRVLVIGHVATRWALDHYVNGIPLEALAQAPFEWQEGWEYRFHL